MLTPRLAPDARERRLADTYKKNSWETVEDYQRVAEYKREHPDATKGNAVEDLGLDGDCKVVLRAEQLLHTGGCHPELDTSHTRTRRREGDHEPGAAGEFLDGGQTPSPGRIDRGNRLLSTQEQ